jgi:hypothetical protein
MLLARLAFSLAFLTGQSSTMILYNPRIELTPGGILSSEYRNEPFSSSPMLDITTTVHLQSPPFNFNNLLYKGKVSGSNTIIGLALYPNFFSGFRRLVGSLRYFGYQGHIILGVNSQLPKLEFEYLKKNEVTLFSVQSSECQASALNTHREPGIIRGRCSADIPDLKLEWGRYEMARRWLIDCETCTGWAMVLDTRDIFFQDDPVSALLPSSPSFPSPPLLFSFL